MTEQSTEIVVGPEKPLRNLSAGSPIVPIIPRDLAEVSRLAEGVWKSGLAPSSYKSPAQVMIGLMTALELGVPPLQGLKGIAIINGRPAVWGDLAVGLAQRNGHLVNHEARYDGEPGTDGYTAIYRAWRRGQPNPYEGRFSVKDAKLAKLWGNTSKQPWIQYPDRMLMNRARAFALRDGFADCLGGLAIAEEARDMAPPIERKASTDFLDDGIPAREESAALTPVAGANIPGRETDFLEDPP